MLDSESRRQEVSQRRANYLLWAISENARRALIEVDDPVIFVNRDNGVVGDIEDGHVQRHDVSGLRDVVRQLLLGFAVDGRFRLTKLWQPLLPFGKLQSQNAPSFH
ncbi:MAG: hypothetical protein VCC99_07360 [Alphaproteobacteria bacterium]